MGGGLKVGDILLARLPGISGRGSSGEQHQYTTAIIRWRGQTAFGGHKYGVEITVSTFIKARVAIIIKPLNDRSQPFILCREVVLFWRLFFYRSG